MVVTVELPVISGFFGGHVSRVLVAVGDTVRVDTPLLELENENCVVEYPSHIAGRVAEMLVSAGDRVDWGTPLLVIDAPDQS